MSSSLFPAHSNTPSLPNTSVPNNMMAQFGQFMQLMQGRNPQQLLNNLLNSGKAPREAYEQAQQMTRQFMPMLSGFFRR